jgi:hypothetical protein
MELVVDGFDTYGPAGIATINSSPLLAPLLTSGDWNQAIPTGNNSALTIVAPLSSTGQAIQFTSGNGSGNSYVQKTLNNPSRVILGLRFQVVTLNASLTAGPLTIQYNKGATPQFTVMVNPTTGTISLRTGGIAGTALATSASSITTATTHYLELDVTVGAAGAYQVWLDGVSLFSGTGNTRGDGANNNTDNFTVGCSGSAGNNATQQCIIDDLYCFDTSGTTSNAVLLTNPRIESQPPSGDSQTQFSFGAGMLGYAYWVTTSTNAAGANQLVLRRFVSPINCTLNSVSILPQATSGAAKFRMVAYSDSAGSPNTLLSSGTEVIGCTAGTVLTGALTTPQSLTGGTAYWIGYITDTSVAIQQVDTSTTGQRAANTYTSGAPGTAPAMTAGQPSWEIWGNTTGGTTNWSTLIENPSVGDLSYAASSTVNNEDLYTFAPLTTSPTTIHTVALKSVGKKSDAGARTIDLRMNSGGTDSGGSNTGLLPLSSYSMIASYFATDPHTGSAWTSTALNSATAGPKIAS